MFTEIINENKPSLLRSIENTCFLPARYLFKGKTVKLLNNVIIWDAPSFEEKKKLTHQDYLTTAAAIASLIPGMILGVIFKGLNLLSSEYRADLSRVHATKPQPLPTSDKSFSELQALVEEKWKIFGQLNSASQWQDEAFITQVSDLMETGYLYSLKYFEELSKDCANDPKKMAARMVIQPQNQHEARKLGFTFNVFTDYSHTFFAFPRIYHIARSLTGERHGEKMRKAFGRDPDEEMPFKQKMKFSLEDQEPFFNPTRPQYRWRQLYNAFCAMVDKDGLRSFIRDTRFPNWSIPDLSLTSFYPAAPDTLPT